MKLLISTLFSISILLSASAQNTIDITYKSKDDNSVVISYSKNKPGSYFISLEFTYLDNCLGNRVIQKVIKNKSGTFVTLKPSNADRGIGFRYKTRYVMGNPNPDVNEDIIYALPLQQGSSANLFTAQNLGEKYYGSCTTEGWKAFVYYSKNADSVFAMRKGTVVKIENSFTNDSRFEKEFTSKRNRILVEHEDGTYANYQGFHKDEIYVKLGQKIYPHTPLGKMEIFNEELYRLDFYVYHYLDNLMDSSPSTLSDRIFKTKFLDPVFYVNDKPQRIESGSSYNVSFNNELKVQEFSRRELKRYKKKPHDFQ